MVMALWRHEIMHPEDPNDIIEITVSSDSVNLDEWTGNNRRGGFGWHAEAYKVLAGSKYPYLLRACRGLPLLVAAVT